MTVPVSGQAAIVLIAICGAAALLTWITGQPWSLLGAVAAVSSVAPMVVSLLSPLLLAAIFALVLELGGARSPAEPETLWQLAVFVAVGVVIAGLQRFTRTAAADGTGRRASPAIDRTQAGNAFEVGERELRLVLDRLPALIWCATPQGDPIYLNQRLTEFVGLTLDQLDVPGSTRMRESMIAVVHPDDREHTAQALSRAFASGQPVTVQHRLRRGNGEYQWVEVRGEPLYDGNRIILWFGVDVQIDEEKRMHAALRAAQGKLARASQAASLAELSASIAHEVNQPLAAIVANSNACRHWLVTDPPNIQRALLSTDRIVRDANSAAMVVSRMRALFKQDVHERSQADINELILEVRRLLTDEIAARGASIRVDLEQNLPPLAVDRVQIQQVLVNLIRNALDALKSSDVSKPIVVRSRRQDARTVCFEVRDEGVGLRDMDSIFEPFFTTKPEGMGIGLAVSRTIVEAHNGTLWAEPNTPAGAVFIAALPIA